MMTNAEATGLRLPIRIEKVGDGWLTEPLLTRHPGVEKLIARTGGLSWGTGTKFRVHFEYNAPDYAAGLPPPSLSGDLYFDADGTVGTLDWQSFSSSHRSHDVTHVTHVMTL